MAKTMQQMLDALLAQATAGQGEGGNSGVGGGAGGGGADGYSVAGTSSIPTYGPSRLQFSASQATMADGSSNGNGSGKPGSNGTLGGSSKINTDTFRENTDSTLAPVNIPEKYKEAVKHYFSEDS